MSSNSSNLMEYRNLGRSGLQVSVISFGTWTNSQTSVQQMVELLKVCFEKGVNYIDTALSYAEGRTVDVLGKAIKELNQDRSKLVISTKILGTPNSSINSKCSTSRKNIQENMKLCLEKLQLEYVDLVYAHSYDETTTMEQTCRAFHEIIEDGLSFYWGTSNWDAEKVFQAMQVCRKYKLHQPIAAQNQYNMMNRNEIEVSYQTLFETYKYGLAAFSPLLGGYLTGKYLDQHPQKVGRFSSTQTGGVSKNTLQMLYINNLNLEQTDQSLREMKQICEKELNCSLVHLAIAWTIKFKHTSTALIGARNTEQLTQSLAAMEVYSKLTPEMIGRINKILKNDPTPRKDWRKM